MSNKKYLKQSVDNAFEFISNNSFIILEVYFFLKNPIFIFQIQNKNNETFFLNLNTENIIKLDKNNEEFGKKTGYIATLKNINLNSIKELKNDINWIIDNFELTNLLKNNGLIVDNNLEIMLQEDDSSQSKIFRDIESQFNLIFNENKKEGLDSLISLQLFDLLGYKIDLNKIYYIKENKVFLTSLAKFIFVTMALYMKNKISLSDSLKELKDYKNDLYMLKNFNIISSLNSENLVNDKYRKLNEFSIELPTTKFDWRFQSGQCFANTKLIVNNNLVNEDYKIWIGYVFRNYFGLKDLVKHAWLTLKKDNKYHILDLSILNPKFYQKLHYDSYDQFVNSNIDNNPLSYFSEKSLETAYKSIENRIIGKVPDDFIYIGKEVMLKDFDYSFTNLVEINLEQKPTINKSTNNDSIKVGRNELCFCGSGKKYKKCCLNKVI